MTDKINLNDADQDQLDGVDELKGHGFEIVRFRKERGGFTDVRQLDEVPGLTGKVSNGTYEQLSTGAS
jgi:competence protein ComEA